MSRVGVPLAPAVRWVGQSARSGVRWVGQTAGFGGPLGSAVRSVRQSAGSGRPLGPQTAGSRRLLVPQTTRSHSRLVRQAAGSSVVGSGRAAGSSEALAPECRWVGSPVAARAGHRRRACGRVGQAWGRECTGIRQGAGWGGPQAAGWASGSAGRKVGGPLGTQRLLPHHYSPPSQRPHAHSSRMPTPLQSPAVQRSPARYR
jgi:hypothetical protein